MKKIVLSTAILISFLMTGCGVKQVDISKYLDIEEVGYNNYGHARSYLNESFFLEEDIFPDSVVDYSQLEEYEVEVTPTYEGTLKNGDIVKFDIKYDSDLYEKEFNVKLINSKEEYKVENLEKAFLKKDDLTDGEYKKLKSETNKKVNAFIESSRSTYKDYENLEFVDLFIQNTPSELSNEMNDVSLVFLYKVKELDKLSQFYKDDKISYIFVNVRDLEFDKNGKLSKYSIPNLSEYSNIVSYAVNSEPLDIETIKGEYLENNSTLEKIEITQ